MSTDRDHALIAIPLTRHELDYLALVLRNRRTMMRLVSADCIEIQRKVQAAQDRLDLLDRGTDTVPV